MHEKKKKFLLFQHAVNNEHEDVLEELSEKWLLMEYKHNVSGAAANAYWDLAFKLVPRVLELKKKKVPKFVHQRRKLINDDCPKIEMEFYFRKKEDDSIVKFSGTNAPLKQYQNNSKYEKLYELAYVQVWPIYLL